ncbi:MAG: hypothetical protein ACREF9_21520, partial [Opitutaceae bacterium]
TLRGSAKFGDDVAPYLGLGWSKAPRQKGFGFFSDIGVMFSGSPSVKLSVSGTIGNDPAFQRDLAQEVKKVNDELDYVKVYPVIRFGVMYRF